MKLVREVCGTIEYAELQKYIHLEEKTATVRPTEDEAISLGNFIFFTNRRQDNLT